MLSHHSEFNKLKISTFGHLYENLCLTAVQLEQNLYPNIYHLEKGFRLLPPVTRDALSIASINCEFCKTDLGLEVIRVIVVDRNLEVRFHELVKPQGNLLDPLSDLHGITAWDIDSARYSLCDVQEKLMSMCDQNTVLVGHDLNCELKGLKLVHFRCADTKVLFNQHRENKLNVRKLSSIILKKHIVTAVDYPRTTMELCLLFDAQIRQNVPQRSFGSKQELIVRVHTQLLSKYQGRLVKPLTTCLRGKDTIRIHCKKWDQLMHIEGLLEQLDSDRHFTQVCLPISMKTKSQKKGFFVYLKFPSVLDVPDALDDIRRTGFFKAEVADRVTNKKKSTKSINV